MIECGFFYLKIDKAAQFYTAKTSRRCAVSCSLRLLVPNHFFRLATQPAFDQLPEQ